MSPAIRDLEPLAIGSSQGEAALENFLQPSVKFRAPRTSMTLHSLGGQKIDRGTQQLLAGRYQAATFFVLLREPAQTLAHACPAPTEFARALGVRLPGCFHQGRAHCLDFPNSCAHLDREVNREIPHVVGRKIAKHRLDFARERSRSPTAFGGSPVRRWYPLHRDPTRDRNDANH